MTEISKQPWCDHRDLMKERADILDKLRQFLAIKCDHGRAARAASAQRELQGRSSSSPPAPARLRPAAPTVGVACGSPDS